MKNTMKRSLSVALGTTFIAAISASPVANADTNPFGMENIESGYMQVADGKCGSGKMKMDENKMKKDGKCGSGKCGANKKKKEAEMKKEGKCGASHMKEKEGKCGKSKVKKEAKMKKEGKCGASHMKKKEGKCGAGK